MHVTAQGNLENVMLSEETHQWSHTVCSYLYKMLRIEKSIEKQLINGHQELGMGGLGNYQYSLCDGEGNVLKLIVWIITQVCGYTERH